MDTRIGMLAPTPPAPSRMSHYADHDQRLGSSLHVITESGENRPKRVRRRVSGDQQGTNIYTLAIDGHGSGAYGPRQAGRTMNAFAAHWFKDGARTTNVQLVRMD